MIKCSENGDFDVVYLLDRLSNLEMHVDHAAYYDCISIQLSSVNDGFYWDFSFNLWWLQITALIELVGLEQGYSK